MILRDEILEQSDFVQYFKKKGLDEGLELGVEKGSLHMLRLMLRSRFPGLETRPELERLTGQAKIERIAERLLAAKDRDAALNILRRL